MLDEPTTGVDPVLAPRLLAAAGAPAARGLTILLTTPYLDEAERCGRVALMDRGRLLTVNEPGHLRSQVEGSFLEVVARPRRQALERLRQHPEVSDVEVFGDRLHVTLPDVAPARAAEAARRLTDELEAGGVEVESARAAQPSLEDVFIRRIRAAAADTPDQIEVT